MQTRRIDGGEAVKRLAARLDEQYRAGHRAGVVVGVTWTVFVGLGGGTVLFLLLLALSAWAER